MVSKPNQKEFGEMIALAALATCFKPDEPYLSLDQILVRGFAPTEMYGKKWIADLLAKKVIEVAFSTASFPEEGAPKTLFVKNPAGAAITLEKLIVGLSNKISSLIKSDFQFSLYLKEFAYDVAACECIEYANYYAGKSQLSIVNESHSNPRLRLLLLECDQRQVFMLIWRAIKNISRQKASVPTIDFVGIVDDALASYIRYKKQGTEVERYDRPHFMKPSIIAKFLEFLTVEKDGFFREFHPAES